MNACRLAMLVGVFLIFTPVNDVLPGYARLPAALSWIAYTAKGMPGVRS